MELKNCSEQEQKNWEIIFEKCREDAAFKQALVANPVQVLEEITGDKLDLHGFEYVITDKSDATKIYIDIPTDTENVELTDEQLELVAGGLCIVKSKVEITFKIQVK